MDNNVDKCEIVKKTVKMAREHSYLGLYEKAIQNFEKSMNLIKEIQYDLSFDQDASPIIKEWESLASIISDEIDIAQQLYTTIYGKQFQQQKLNSEFIKKENNINFQNVLQQQEKPKQECQQPKLPFGKKPFQWQQERLMLNQDKDIQPINNDKESGKQFFIKADSSPHKDKIPNQNQNQWQPATSTSNGVYQNLNHNNYRDKQSQQSKATNYTDRHQFNYMDQINYLLNQNLPAHCHSNSSDPDVWPEPQPYQPYKATNKQKNPKVNNTGKNSQNAPPAKLNNQGGTNTNSNSSNADKRNYQKPWMQNAKSEDLADKETQNQQQLQQQQSSYHNYVYPDGKGPDSELIDMLERDIVQRTPGVKFEDIAELDEAKNTLQETVLLPLLMPANSPFKPWKGVLMFGPPGTGKTMLAKAVATQLQTTFFNVHASSLASKWRGESEKLVRILFEMARYYAPSTVFFDEIDALGQKRCESDGEANRKVKTELLLQIDGIQPDNVKHVTNSQHITIIAATNRPQDLDEALRRRFEKRIYIPLPNSSGRKALFDISLKGIELDASLDLQVLVEKTDGYSGCDIANVCREAAMIPVRRVIAANGGYLQQVVHNHNKTEEEKELYKRTLQAEMNKPLLMVDFLDAIKKTNKSVGNADLKAYEQWLQQYGSS